MYSSRRIFALRTLAVSAAAALTVGVGTSWANPTAHTTTRSTLAGTWSGQYSGGYNGTFTINWKQSGSKLTGTIKLSSPRGTYGITGSVKGSAIQFGAVAVGATYAGSVSGKSMSGTYRAVPKGGSWSAKKTSSEWEALNTEVNNVYDPPTRPGTAASYRRPG